MPNDTRTNQSGYHRTDDLRFWAWQIQVAADQDVGGEVVRIVMPRTVAERLGRRFLELTGGPFGADDGNHVVEPPKQEAKRKVEADACGVQWGGCWSPDGAG